MSPFSKVCVVVRDRILRNELECRFLSSISWEILHGRKFERRVAIETANGIINLHKTNTEDYSDGDVHHSSTMFVVLEIPGQGTTSFVEDSKEVYELFDVCSTKLACADAKSQEKLEAVSHFYRHLVPSK